MGRPPLTRDHIEKLVARNAPLELAGACLTEADLSRLDLAKADLARADLSGANLSNADLSDANLSGANLRDCVLFGADLSGAELVGADLRGANLTDCKAPRAGFGASRLAGASLFEANLAGSSFSKADLEGCDLRCASFERTRLHEANLREVDASHANLREAELDRSTVDRATFDGADLRGARLAHLRGFERSSWLEVDVRETDFRGAYLLRRRIIDENYLNEFRLRGRGFELLYHVWQVTSDCGRSFWRWAAWTGAVVCLFAAAYRFVAIDYGSYETWLSPLYFSVVTLTTLGYGDGLPASTAAQTLAMLEVCLGYVALGGLISILANKMARRGE